MIYTIKKITNINISSFNLFENNLYFFDKENKAINVFNEVDNFDLVLKNNELFYILIWNDLLHVNYNKFFNLKDKKYIVIEDISCRKEDFIECLILNNQLFVKKFSNNDEIFFYKINKNLNVKIKEHIGNPVIIINELSIELVKTNIQCINNKSKKVLWQHRFSELIQSEKASLYGKILLSNNKLFFNLGDLETGGLVCLEAKTGEVLQYFNDSYYEIFTDEDFIYTTKFENILCRINTKTLKIEEWNCNTLIIENGFDNIHDHRCEAFNNKFYFTQSLGDNKAKLGVLDWDKKQLVYKHEFEPQNGAIGSIQVNKTRIFVHTQDNTLHVFEKEKNEML